VVAVRKVPPYKFKKNIQFDPIARASPYPVSEMLRVLNKNRTVDTIYKHNNYVNIPSQQIFRPYLVCHYYKPKVRGRVEGIILILITGIGQGHNSRC
jgi:hypothetical protein